ncbi:MAG: hypothetical protein M3P26_05995 [Gemmatimonadota bacterium]|nr:hypothetical protein [Gemmatimonadota bacterium]
MKRLIIVFAVAGAAASTSACASRPPETELTASDFDLNPLVGEWRGDYSNPEAGRSGTIAFTLRAGESSASGKVIMIPGKADSLASAAAMARSVINISFIRKEGRKVSGTLDPYLDPQCACRVTTNFEGSFTDARTIEGTFTTVPSQTGRNVTGGRWKVTRVKRL